jgi:hypothetical protein
LTSVRDAQASAPAAPAIRPQEAAPTAPRASVPPVQRGSGPRCHCGTPIAHTRGKRARMYCSDRCKKRAQRAIARGEALPPATGEAAPAPAKRDRRLGPTGETTDTQVSGGFAAPSTANPDTDGAEEAARDGRHRLREALGEISSDPQLCKCGKYALAGGVTPKITPGGRAYLSGVATCGKVHLCPVCGATIRSVRSAELQAAGVAWETYGGADSEVLVAAREATLRLNAAAEAGEPPMWEDLVAEARAEGVQGGGLAMLTLTMRHYARHELRDLVRQQREAWKRSLGQNAGRAWRRAKREYGVVGFVRAWECTHGEANGWHPHWHVLVFFERPLTAEEGAALEEVIYEAWSAALEHVGAYLPDREHGVRLDLSGHGEGGPLARYLMKFQDGRTAWSTAAEMTRLDIKVGRDGHRTPFEIARTFIDVEDQEQADVERDRDLWLEYEDAAAGLRSLYWSNGLRARLAPLVELDARTDAQLAAAEDQKATPVAVILAEPWHRHIAPRKGRSLALLKACERDGVRAVRTLLEGWGLIWGVDVLDPPEHEQGVLPTADEVLRDRTRATMAARAEVWRAELERQHRAARRATADAGVRYDPDAWQTRAAAHVDRATELAAPTTAAAAKFRTALRRAKQRRGAEIDAALDRCRVKAAQE